MVCQGVKRHHAVGQPAPDQWRQNQHQGWHQPERHGQHQRKQGSDGRHGSPTYAGEIGGPGRLFQGGKAALCDQLHDHGCHQRGHHEQTAHQHEWGEHQDHDQGNQHGFEFSGPHRLQPAPHHLQPVHGFEQLGHPGEQAVQVKVAQACGHAHHQHQGQQRPQHDLGVQAVHQRSPEGIQDGIHGLTPWIARRQFPLHSASAIGPGPGRRARTPRQCGTGANPLPGC